MLNSLVNVTFTLSLFEIYCNIEDIDHTPDQFGWAQYGPYGNGVLDNFIAMSPNGDDDVIRLHQSVRGFVDFIHKVVPNKPHDNVPVLFSGIFS